MRREQLILPPLTAFEVTIFRNEPLPYPAIYKVNILIQLQVKSNMCNLSDIINDLIFSIYSVARSKYTFQLNKLIKVSLHVSILNKLKYISMQ